MDKCSVCQTDLGNKKKRWYLDIDVVERVTFMCVAST